MATLLGVPGMEYDCTVTIACPGCGTEMVCDLFITEDGSGDPLLVWETEEGTEDTCRNDCDLTGGDYDQIFERCRCARNRLGRPAL